MADYILRRQAQTSSRLHGNNFFTFSFSREGGKTGSRLTSHNKMADYLSRRQA